MTLSLVAAGQAGAAKVRLSISIVRNRFVDGSHHTIRLLGTGCG